MTEYQALFAPRRPHGITACKTGDYPGYYLCNIEEDLAWRLLTAKTCNVSDKAMTVGIVMTVPNKFRLCAVMMPTVNLIAHVIAHVMI